MHQLVNRRSQSADSVGRAGLEAQKEHPARSAPQFRKRLIVLEYPWRIRKQRAVPKSVDSAIQNVQLNSGIEVHAGGVCVLAITHHYVPVSILATDHLCQALRTDYRIENSQREMYGA